MRYSALVSLALFQLCLQRHAAAAPSPEDILEELDKVPAVQNRKFQLGHEFSAGIGILPTDPFTKGFSLTGRYTWHTNTTWALEGRFDWIIDSKTSLRKQLEGNFAIEPKRFATFDGFAQGGILFKPAYGKLAFLNGKQAYGEFYFSFHGALAQVSGGARDDEHPNGKPDRLALGVAPGFGLRGFLSEHLSLRLDTNWMIMVDASGDTHFPLFLTLSLSAGTRSAQ